MKWKNVLFVVFISAATAIGSVWGFSKYQRMQTAGTQEPGKLPANYASFFDKSSAPSSAIDFTAASASATPAVVHIKVETKSRKVTNNLPSSPFGDLFGDDSPFGDFFGGPRVQTIPGERASGSGVIISDDGYIVTNNHVVANADKITVTTSDKKTYKARVIGTDPSSDLAVVKIEASHLPYLVYGNSDDLKLGQWVIAIGYPFTLDVTVTAGIVSAKARDIGLGRSKSNGSSTTIESYIQTDAAVNPGNSGGALINTDGQLIGINSAIASPTGSFTGYSFAIPVNIAKKVVNDIIKYGAVQRGYIGITFLDITTLTDEQKKELKIDNYNTGLYVGDVSEDGAAQAAGLKKGDVITAINDRPVNNSGQMSAIMGEKKPGDKLNVTYMRDGKQLQGTLTLKNSLGTYKQMTAEEASSSKLGADLVTLTPEQASKYGINGGVQVTNLKDGAFKKAKIQNGFIIISIDGQTVHKAEDARKILKESTGLIQLRGIYPDGDAIYGYPLRLDNEDSDNSGN